MAVRGSGTSADPYLVNNWSDFCSVKNNAGCYIFWEDLPANQKVIDLNEIIPEGYSSQFSINARQVDFNGWTIKNLTIDSSRSQTAQDQPAIKVADSQGTMIKNGKFLNCYFTCSYIIGANEYSSRWGELLNCVFSGMWHSRVSGGSTYVSPSTISVTRCSMNFKVILDNTGYKNLTHLCNYCSVRLDIQSSVSGGTHVNFESYHNSCHDSKYDIKLRATDPGENDKGIQFHGANNDVYIVDSDIPCVYGYASESSPFNSGAVSPVYTTNANDTFNQEWYAPVTEAQMQSAEYLLSIGFPIATGVGE